MGSRVIGLGALMYVHSCAVILGVSFATQLADHIEVTYTYWHNSVLCHWIICYWMRPLFLKLQLFSSICYGVVLFNDEYSTISYRVLGSLGTLINEWVLAMLFLLSCCQTGNISNLVSGHFYACDWMYHPVHWIHAMHISAMYISGSVNDLHWSGAETNVF